MAKELVVDIERPACGMWLRSTFFDDTNMIGRSFLNEKKHYDLIKTGYCVYADAIKPVRIEDITILDRDEEYLETKISLDLDIISELSCSRPFSVSILKGNLKITDDTTFHMEGPNVIFRIKVNRSFDSVIVFRVKGYLMNNRYDRKIWP